MSFQLPSQENKADYVLKQFDRIAARYDLANDLISLGMHRLWKRKAVDELLCSHSGSKAKAGNYLDLCTGTGDLALMIARRLGPESTVTGLDFSSQMLAVAKERQNKSGPSLSKSAQLQWKQGDAQSLPFADNYFDGAIISFGLRNLADLQKGLDEMSRVVKSGGLVLNLDLGQPELPIFTPCFLFFFDKIVPLIGEIVQKDRQAYTYLPESRKSYPHPEKLRQMFAKAGLVDIAWHQLALGSVALHVGKVS